MKQVPFSVNYKTSLLILHVFILIVTVFIIIELRIFSTVFFSHKDHDAFTMFKSILILLPSFISAYKLARIKNVYIIQDQIIIKNLLGFTNRNLLSNHFLNFKLEIIKPSGSGPGVLEFPYKKMILVYEQTQIEITSKSHNNVEQLILYLQSKV